MLFFFLVGGWAQIFRQVLLGEKVLPCLVPLFSILWTNSLGILLKTKIREAHEHKQKHRDPRERHITSKERTVNTELILNSSDLKCLNHVFINHGGEIEHNPTILLKLYITVV